MASDVPWFPKAELIWHRWNLSTEGGCEKSVEDIHATDSRDEVYALLSHRLSKQDDGEFVPIDYLQTFFFLIR